MVSLVNSMCTGGYQMGDKKDGKEYISHVVSISNGRIAKHG